MEHETPYVLRGFRIQGLDEIKHRGTHETQRINQSPELYDTFEIEERTSLMVAGFEHKSAKFEYCTPVSFAHSSNAAWAATMMAIQWL